MPREIAETIADWLEEHKGDAITFEKVKPGEEQFYPTRNSVSSTACRPACTNRE